MVEDDQARLAMVVTGEEEAQVIAATAVMRIEAEAEVGDTEDVADVKCTNGLICSAGVWDQVENCINDFRDTNDNSLPTLRGIFWG